MLILLLPVVGAVALFVFMCLRGTAEPNRFGPSRCHTAVPAVTAG
jgi:uncharacterized membrane protein YhaH (DUF805 family)